MAFKKGNVNEAKDFDDVLALVGGFGKYQIFLIVVILIPTSFIISLIVNLVMFQSEVPKMYWCDPPGRGDTNFTEEEWWNLTVPRDNEGNFEKCLQYDFEIVEVFGQSVSVNIENENDTKACMQQWAHDQSSFQESIGTSMNYYCDKEMYSTHIFSIHTVGAVLGTFLLPIIADKYTGRRMMFFICSGIHLVFHILFLVVPIYGVLLFARLFEGIPFQTDYQMPYIIGLELMAPEKRAMASFLSFVAWTAGMCFTAFIAWILPHWWYTQLIMVLLSLLFFAYWRILPRSPRWLLSKGKYDDCLDILMKVAKVNGNDVDRLKLENELRCVSEEEEKIDFKVVLKNKIILFRGILLMIYSFVVLMAYGCTLFNVSILPGNPYLSFFVLSASELPSNILSYLSVHYLGRRFTAISTMIIALIFTVIAPFVLEARSTLLFIVSMIKIFITQGIYVVYVITCEVFPTPMRSIGMGSVVVFGMIGIFVSKYIVQASASGDGALQYWIMVGIELLGVLVAIPIPETIGLPLPQTLPEANNLGKNRPFFKWIHHWNKDKFVQVETNKKTIKECFK